MKKALLFLTLITILSSCYPTYKMLPYKYEYSNTINFTIEKIVEGHSISNGSGAYYPSKGNKFVIVYLTAKNDLNKKQDLNFNNFALINDKNKSKYPVQFAMLISPINLGAKTDSYIRKDDTKRRKLVFIFPKDEKAQYLMVNDKIFDLKYL